MQPDRFFFCIGSGFVLGLEEKGSGERSIAFLFWQSPSFGNSTCTASNLWQVLVTQSSRDVVICTPSQRYKGTSKDIKESFPWQNDFIALHCIAFL